MAPRAVRLFALVQHRADGAGQGRCGWRGAPPGGARRDGIDARWLALTVGISGAPAARGPPVKGTPARRSPVHTGLVVWYPRSYDGTSVGMIRRTYLTPSPTAICSGLYVYSADHTGSGIGRRDRPLHAAEGASPTRSRTDRDPALSCSRLAPRAGEVQKLGRLFVSVYGPVGAAFHESYHLESAEQARRRLRGPIPGAAVPST